MQIISVNNKKSRILSLYNKVWLFVDRNPAHHLHDVVPHLHIGVLVQSMCQYAVFDVSLLGRLDVVFYLLVEFVENLLL